MEWCFDECNLALYHPDKEAVSTTANPYCSAAVLFSKRGNTSRKVVLYPKFTEGLKLDFFFEGLRKLQGLLQPASDAIGVYMASVLLPLCLLCRDVSHNFCPFPYRSVSVSVSVPFVRCI